MSTQQSEVAAGVDSHVLGDLASLATGRRAARCRVRDHRQP
jgi:hypothetical protein